MSLLFSYSHISQSIVPPPDATIAYRMSSITLDADLDVHVRVLDLLPRRNVVVEHLLVGLSVAPAVLLSLRRTHKGRLTLFPKVSPMHTAPGDGWGSQQTIERRGGVSTCPETPQDPTHMRKGRAMGRAPLSWG